MSNAGHWGSGAVRDKMVRANLTPERERQLLLETRNAASPAARQAALAELWESHSKLVASIASRYRHLNIDLLDLIGAGHLGLHTAIARFEPDRYESRLSTYAIGWIRWHIQDYIRRNASAVRLPNSAGHRQLAQLSSRLLADARRSCMRDGTEPTDSEVCLRISRRIGLPPDEVACSLRLLQEGTLSLNHESGSGDGAPRSLQDTLADDACSEDEVILRLDYAKMRKRIMTLTEEILGERERAVFLARCMTDHDDVVHLDTLAAQFGVSRDRIYQLEASAKRKIAAVLGQEGYNHNQVDMAQLRLPATRAQRRRAPAAETPAEETMHRGASDPAARVVPVKPQHDSLAVSMAAETMLAASSAG
jgi:RNA polymerase sigma-32 factor